VFVGPAARSCWGLVFGSTSRERAGPKLLEYAQLATQTVAQLEHMPLAQAQRAEDLPQRLVAQRHLG
jgi:hypothetical protein